MFSLKHEAAWQGNKLYNKLYLIQNYIPWIENIYDCTKEMLNIAALVQMAKHVNGRCMYSQLHLISGDLTNHFNWDEIQVTVLYTFVCLG